MRARRVRPGVFVLDRALQFTADKARGRDGDALPIQGLDILARANAIGVAYTFVTRSSPYLTVVASVPFAHVSVNSTNPIVSTDRWGLGDIFVQPIKAGWRKPHHDVVTSYAFFAPTGKFEPKTGVGVGRGYWTHQFSLGGAGYVDTTRARRASVLVSYDLNQRMRGVDIRAATCFRSRRRGGGGEQGGRAGSGGVCALAGERRSRRGAPPGALGLRTRTFGLGPEVDVVIPSIGVKGDFRLMWDFGTRARPQGVVFAGGLGYRAWSPSRS